MDGIFIVDIFSLLDFVVFSKLVMSVAPESVEVLFFISPILVFGVLVEVITVLVLTSVFKF